MKISENLPDNLKKMAQTEGNNQPNNITDNQDFGFGTKWTNRIGRFINEDGQFNVTKSGENWRDRHLYQTAVTISWSRFFLLTLLAYILINAFFATIHLIIGIDTLTISPSNNIENFFHAFYFSVQTFTTVGYGSISPTGIAANAVAALCALVGLMSFALVTGLLFARFSRPTAKINFSKNALISPYKEGKGFMFRIINARQSQLIDLLVQVTFTWIEVDKNGIGKRKFQRLNLERERVYLFPLNWTIVHPIDNTSPFCNCDMRKMQEIDAEVLIVISAYDDTFAQQVHTKYSYTYEEMIQDAAFNLMYHTNEEGQTVLEMDKLNDFKMISK